MLLGKLLLHVFIVHAPDIFFIQLQGGVDNFIAVVPQGMGKADVGGAVNQHLVTPGAQHIQCADHPAQHAVGIGDFFLPHSYLVVIFMPGGNFVIIFLPGRKITVSRMLCALDNGSGHGGDGWEIHVSHPHRNQVEALFAGAFGTVDGAARLVYRQSIQPLPVQNGSKIIFHGAASLVIFSSLYPGI